MPKVRIWISEEGERFVQYNIEQNPLSETYYYTYRELSEEQIEEIERVRDWNKEEVQKILSKYINKI